MTIPDWVNPNDRDQLADDIIEHIRQRTERGLDKNGQRFVRYSPEYVKSMDFKIAGKSRHVNLTLSGDMLIALDVLKSQKGNIRIGYENHSEENAKADGNIRGTYGSGTPDRSKARDFLGISQRKVMELAEQYKPEEEEPSGSEK